MKVNREIEADRQGKTLQQLEAELGIVSEDAVEKPGEARRRAADAAADTGLWRKVCTLLSGGGLSVLQCACTCVG